MVQYNTLSTGNPVFNYAVIKSSGGEVSGLQLRLVIGAVRCRSGFLARVRDRYRVLATELGFEGHMG